MISRDIDPSDRSIADEDLGALSPDEQREVMEAWFRANFENPAERLPFESAEGGYQWIWGGPYDAHDKLGGRFGGVVPDEVIDSLASDLTQELPDWAPSSHQTDDHDSPDDVPPAATPSDESVRFRRLVAQHDQWLRDHPVPAGNAAERRMEVIRRLDAAEEALRFLGLVDERRATFPHGIGHNRPPVDLTITMLGTDAPTLSPAEVSMAAAAITEGRRGMESAEPDPAAIKHAVSRLLTVARAVGLWLAKNTSCAAEEFSKALGKGLGAALAGGVTYEAMNAFSQLRGAAAALETWAASYLP